MTDTSALIDRLAARGGQPKGNKHLAFALPIIAAVIASGISLTILLGAPFAPLAADGPGPLLVKWGFALCVMLGGLLALYSLAHPARSATIALLVAAASLAVVAGLGLFEYTGGPAGFPGATWRTCLAAMVLLGMIGFAAAIYAARQFAPVRLREAGMAAGLAGGGLAAFAYAPFCPEHGMSYLLAFYAVPIVALAAFGWLTGPRLLRW